MYDNKYDLYLRNGLIVTETGRFHGGVVVHGGKIIFLIYGNNEIEAAEVIDLSGRILLPGVIDEHAHFSEVGRDYEGYSYGSKAAAAGGVTTILDMPLNDLPPTIDRVTLRKKRELVHDQSIVDYAHWGGLINNNLDHLEELDEEGVVGFKAFMRTVSDFPRIDDDLLYAGLLKMKDMGNVLGVHAENDALTSYLKAQLEKAGRTDRHAWAESRPPAQELEAINRAIFWSKETGGRLHVLHVSLAEGVRAVARAALDGFPVSVETCSHYLFFDERDHLEIGPYAKAAPPLRSREDVESLWECVKAGLVDAIASDHSPFPPERHAKGLTNPFEGGGITGIQSMLPAIITEGIHKRNLSWEQLTRMMSANPARIFGLYPQKGALLPGSDADFVVIDPDKEWVLEKENLFSRHKHSPYIGRVFKGKIERTIVRGVTVFRNDEIMVEPGYGKLYHRNGRS